MSARRSIVTLVFATALIAVAMPQMPRGRVP